MFKSPLNLPAFTSNKQIDAIMLRLQIAKEGATECLLACIALAGDSQHFASTQGRMMLDLVLEIVVINVV